MIRIMGEKILVKSNTNNPKHDTKTKVITQYEMYFAENNNVYKTNNITCSNAYGKGNTEINNNPHILRSQIMHNDLFIIAC